MSLARETGRGEKASMFHEKRESVGVVQVSMLRDARDAREGLGVPWLCAFLKGMGTHLRVEWLKAERVRQILLVTMAVSFWLGFKFLRSIMPYSDTNPFPTQCPQCLSVRSIKARLQTCLICSIH